MTESLARTWIVIPLFNEAAVIGDVVRQVQKTFAKVVCVDDGSSDNSAEEALAAGAHLVPHPFNLGQGAALQTGLSYALRFPDAQYFVTFDADGQHSVADAARMVQRLDAEPLDVVIGSRFLDQRTEVSPAKRLVLRTVAAVESATSGMKLTDAHNGLRAFNRKAAAAIRITQNRMAHASEITGQIGKLGLRYAEEPVHIEYTEYSKAKGQSLWNSVNILSDLWIK
ncbi:MAG TPA: glycosyltransferase family 2 protein [Propionicimonas sp.]|nr:glycosyltransferase family 2 protein [Propionicimonas sp.]